MVKLGSLIYQQYIALTDAVANYRNTWLSDETVLRLINQHYPDFKQANDNFNRTAVNRSLQAFAGKFDSSNDDRVFTKDFF